MTSEKSEKFRLEIPNEISGLFHKRHDILIADNSLTDIDVILACIYLIENANKKAGVEYSECKEMFVSLGRKDDNFRASLSRAKKNSFLREESRKLFFLSNGLNRIRKVLGQVAKAPVYVIRSGQNFSAIRLFEEFLTLQIEIGDLLVCDSHISHSTLFPFLVLKGKIKSLKILTANVHDTAKFKDYKKKMIKELSIPIEVKINSKIHDRFIISEDKCWSIGSSIKDLGNKDTVVREISEVASSMKDLFKDRWSEANLFT